MDPSTSTSGSGSTSQLAPPLEPARNTPSADDLVLDTDMLHDSFKRSVLLATLPTLDPPYFLAPAIATAARCTTDHLSIVLYSRLFSSGNSTRKRSQSTASRHSRRSDGSVSSISSMDAPISHVALWDDVQRLLTYVYVAATQVAQELDRILFDVDVLLKGLDDELPEGFANGMQITFRIQGDSIPALLPPALASLRTCWCTNRNPESQNNTPRPERNINPNEATSFPVAALGGTFDHLHAGHKILLSMGAWVADEKIIVGVTDEVLLKGKKYRHVMEPINVRTGKVEAFLARFKPSLRCDAVPIADVYGPTASDPNIQALIVSYETLSGAASIDKLRAERALPALKTLVIDVISHNSPKLDSAEAEILKQTKMSSTFIREWIAKRLEDQDNTTTA
ncbi:Nucleotidylyl transferase [Peniophora sp. CONT]|nr:Nucleotidylyl transferase [Peniophora sp. CONT]